MSNRGLTILALLSLSIAAMLLTGYLVQCRLQLCFNDVRRHVDVFELSNGAGRTVVYLEQGAVPPTNQIPRPVDLRFHIRAPDLRRSIWEFDAHRLVFSAVPVATGWILACPIWCLLALSLVFPLAWLRRLMNSRQAPPGFPIEQMAAIPR